MSQQQQQKQPSEAEDEVTPTSTLWVGNLAAGTTDADLMAAFAAHGALDCVAMQAGSRSYAFVMFRSADTARAAMDALRGSVIRRSAIRIQFSRPAKAVRHLWVGGISSSITKEKVEEEFLKFGKIEEFKFFRERNSALIDYYKMEDAISAHKNMNGKRLGGDQLCVDFQRSQPMRKEWPDHDLRNGPFNSRGLGPADVTGGFYDSVNHGPRKYMPHGGQRDSRPTNVLWISYPPSVQIDEQMLHRAMILFGEIERIKCFPSRHYSFIEFRSVDEARRAKEGLQGRLFNDPRIQILYSSNELAGLKDEILPPFPPLRGPGQDMFYNEGPFGPLDLVGSGRSMGPNKFSGSFPNGVPGSSISMKPFAPQGFDPHEGGPELHEFGGVMPNFPDSNANKSGPALWLRSSPSAPGILPSPTSLRPSFHSMPGEWDRLDMRETKRLRMDDDDFGDLSEFPLLERAAFGQRYLSPPIRVRGEVRESPDSGHIWRGILAKGGTHVCCARCVPIGKGITSPLSDVVNCSARTGLDMLTKHYAEANGFDIVFFLPDSEEDFASYTEFLRYLGLKNRAGVAKLDDGTTLFLVPPSDFLTNVLKVKGPERLYGVVLHLPQQSTGAEAQDYHQLSAPSSSNYVDRHDPPVLNKGYNYASRNEEQDIRIGYNRSSSLELPLPYTPGVIKPPSVHPDELRGVQSAPPDHSNSSHTAAPQVGLTPELIATLASLIPENKQPSAAGNVHMPPTPTSKVVSSSTNVVNDTPSLPFQGWSQGHQAIDPVSNIPQHFVSNIPQHFGQQFNSAQIQNAAQPLTISNTGPLNTYVMPSQNGQYLPSQSNQQYLSDPSMASQSSYGMLQTAYTPGVSFNQPVQQQLNPTSMIQPQSTVPMPTERVNMEFASQGTQLQLQNVISGAGHGTSDGDADKSQRYQSTLQFAASLLLQIQQQQQAGAQGVQGSRN
ncbi:flowering time control protein FPA [Ananas comosus]|uniref:Flowering time control protein FPA n=1 Tax=Ananas comosus TaxID=4615 RepID=A0A6P5F4G4_ANACO|nr:flowering time control protein FPA [Ananas comosus]XP_020088165.1 flowering time control protein FPA [Ananas comosus]XP_020088166.1 flowering time control protein FPA [Ananas comosus]